MESVLESMSVQQENIPVHTHKTNTMFVQHGSIPVYTQDNMVMMNRQVAQLFSPLLSSLIQTVPCQSDTALFIPDLTGHTLGHVLNILHMGRTTLDREEVGRNFDIIDGAELLGFHMDSISIAQEKYFQMERNQGGDI